MIILVVVGHCWRGLHGSDLISDELFTVVDSRIYAFHMPSFFVLSGWFFTASLCKVTLAGFYRNRLQRLFWPMVLWTYIFLGAKVLAGSYTNSPVGLDGLWVSPVPGLLHMWFLWALLVLSLVSSVLKPCCGNPKQMMFALSVLAVAAIALQFVTPSPEVANWAGNAIKYAPFFLLGVVVGHIQRQHVALPQRPRLCVAVFLVVLYCWPFLVGYGLASPRSLLLTLCTLGFFAGGGGKSAPRVCRVLGILGTSSMAIYLTHTIFSAGVRELLLVGGIVQLPVHILLGTFVGLVCPLVLLVLARNTHMVRPLGF